ncbi:hypothetical protein, partial [Aequorivita sinensis]|uniref:hypothetical protein n=1 Tax=Aequorivita sinensis TaxID=1382458 RepID=UPI002491E438
LVQQVFPFLLIFYFFRKKLQSAFIQKKVGFTAGHPHNLLTKQQTTRSRPKGKRLGEVVGFCNCSVASSFWCFVSGSETWCRPLQVHWTPARHPVLPENALEQGSGHERRIPWQIGSPPLLLKIKNKRKHWLKA